MKGTAMQTTQALTSHINDQKVLYYSAKWAFFHIDKNLGLVLLPTNEEVERFKAEYSPIEIDLRKFPPSQTLKYISLKEFATDNIRRILKCSYIDRLLTVKPYKDWFGWVEIRFLYKA
jgi:hypothetical protein